MNIQKGILIENRYEILEQIGSGGMSDVYKARDDKLNRFVAIKFLKPEFCEDKNFVKNFQIEAQSAAALLHPNVVGVYDVNQADGIYYIVMEYVDGITLKKYIDRNGKLPVKEATSIAIQIAQGIDAAHNAHIVHRDIKPQNVLISREGKIKVTDFGIARTTTANTISSDILGSVQYISPEQARGGQVDNRTDIYSFGIVYYEMVTGQLPFDGDSPVSIALKHIQENVPLVSSIVPGIPNSVSRIIEKCTQRKPDRRYQKVTSLLSDLKTSLITPNEDFVVLEPEPSESATIIMSEEDAEILRREGDRVLGPETRNEPYTARSGSSQQSRNTAKRSHASSGKGGYGSSRNGSMPRYERAGRSAGNTRGSSSAGSRRSNRIRQSKRKTDRILVACGIIAGILIVVLLVIVCITTFGPESCQGTSSEVQTETAEDYMVAEQIEVPDVIGREGEQARLTLEGLGFVVQPYYESSDSVDEGHVISQSVSGGTSLEKGSQIDLSISTGQDTVMLEEYAGQEKESVVIRLENLGFHVQVLQELSDTVAKGMVIRTDPAAGTPVSKASLINVIVSADYSDMVYVPDVNGYSEQEAMEILDSSGLVPMVSYEDNAEKAGQVISQNPSSGTNVAKGSGVDIIVGEEPKQQEWSEDTYNWSEDETDDGIYWEEEMYSDDYGAVEEYQDDGEYPDGEYPDGRYPDGGYPDEDDME